ncbi:MAG TPA: cytochrome P450 [Capsulimonadaceae bacterium]|jgi:cytochrome P450
MPSLYPDASALLADPLALLAACIRAGDPVVPLRLPFIRAYVLLDPADIERVLVTDNDQFVKPTWLRTRAVKRLLGDGLVTADGDEWREQRRTCQPAFHGRMMAAYAATIQRVALRNVDSWRADQTVHLLHAMTAMTMEIIGETMLGDPMTAERDRLCAIMDTLMTSFRACYKAFGLAPLPPTPGEYIAGRELDRLVDTVIDRAAKNVALGQQTLLEILLGDTDLPQGSPRVVPQSLRLSYRRGGDPLPSGEERFFSALSRKALREQAKTFIAAGHESSALLLTWLFIQLSAKPEIAARIAAEVGGTVPLWDSLDTLPYLQATIKEALRLYPPLWMTGRRTLRPITLSGHAIPAGALLLTSQWAVQRHPAYYAQPDEFRPERWLTDETAALPRFAYFPFGGGPRSCIGQRFATIEIATIAATILQRFRLDVSCGVPIMPAATMTLRPPAEAIATVYTR